MVRDENLKFMKNRDVYSSDYFSFVLSLASLNAVSTSWLVSQGLRKQSEICPLKRSVTPPHPRLLAFRLDAQNIPTPNVTYWVI